MLKDLEPSMNSRKSLLLVHCQFWDAHGILLSEKDKYRSIPVSSFNIGVALLFLQFYLKSLIKQQVSR